MFVSFCLYRFAAIATNLPRSTARQRNISGGNSKTNCKRDQCHRFFKDTRGVESLVQKVHCFRLPNRYGQRNSGVPCSWLIARPPNLPLFVERPSKYWISGLANNIYIYTYSVQALAEVFCFIFTVCEWSGKFISLVLIHLLTHSLGPMWAHAYALSMAVCVRGAQHREISCVLCYYCRLLSYLRMVTSLQWIAFVVCAHSPPPSSSTFFCVFIPLYDYYYYTIDTIRIRRHNRLDCMHGCIYIMCTLILALSLRPLCTAFEKRFCYVFVWNMSARHTHTHSGKRHQNK